MKISFDGITIEDATQKEIVDMIKLLRGKANSSTTKAGMYKLPSKVRYPQGDEFPGAWGEKELLFIINNPDMKPKAMKASPELVDRSIAAIGARRSAIKSGNKSRMGHIAYKLIKERELSNQLNEHKHEKRETNNV